MINSNNLLTIRNELSHIYRFGGICSSIQFNPSNTSSENSKNSVSTIILALNEYLWDRGIDIITTNYANGGCGFMFLTTHSNKNAIKEILGDLDIKKTLKNEYMISGDDIIELSTNNNIKLPHISYIMKINDNYKMNTQNQLSIMLNEDANTTNDVQICERSIVNHLRNLNLITDETDAGLLHIIGDVFKSIADNSKKYAVPGLLIVALFYALNYVYKKWKSLKEETDINKNSESFNENANGNAKSLKCAQHNSSESAEPAEPAEPNEPAEPAEPSEPSEPSESSEFEVNLTTRPIHNNRISTLLKTLEDSEVKHNKTTNIEAKILSLLAETTESH